MSQADTNGDKKINNKEFDLWTKLGYFDILLEGSDVAGSPVGTYPSGSSDVVIGEEASARQVKEVAAIIKALKSGDTGRAIVALYALVSGNSISSYDDALIASVGLALQAIQEGDIATAVGNVFNVVVGIYVADNEEITIQQSTVASVGLVLTALIDDNQIELYVRLNAAIVNVLRDIATELSEEAAEGIAFILVTIVRGQAGTLIVSDVVEIITNALGEAAGLTDDTRDAIAALIEAVENGDAEGIRENIGVVLGAVIGTATGIGGESGVALAAVIQAVAESNRQEAIVQTAYLYKLLTDGGSCNSRSFARIFAPNYPKV